METEVLTRFFISGFFKENQVLNTYMYMYTGPFWKPLLRERTLFKDDDDDDYAQ